MEFISKTVEVIAFIIILLAKVSVATVKFMIDLLRQETPKAKDEAKLHAQIGFERGNAKVTDIRTKMGDRLAKMEETRPRRKVMGE